MRTGKKDPVAKIMTFYKGRKEEKAREGRVFWLLVGSEFFNGKEAVYRNKRHTIV